ncbi:hypothetical protein FFY61_02130, partial [Pediococcus acidilactici]
MSKRKIWNVNEKKHYKMYKSGKQWFFAGMGIVAGLFGAGSTTIASADETPKGANLDLSKSKNLLATKTSATIPGSTSNTNSQNVNSTHNSVTNSASTVNQNTQASASQSASKAASASLSASLKASQAASQQKASQSKSQQAADQASDQAKQASEKAKQQAAKTDTKKASNANSQQHRQADSQKDSTNQQSKSVTKQSTNNVSQANADNRQGSTSVADTNGKLVTSQNSTQSSQNLSISASNSMRDSQSQVTVDQSMSLSRSLIKSDSASTSDTPIAHKETYQDEDGEEDTYTGDWGNTIKDPDYDYVDNDGVVIKKPKDIPGYILDFKHTGVSFGLIGGRHIDGLDGNPNEQEMWFKTELIKFAKTANSIDEINDWIKSNPMYIAYVLNADRAGGRDGNGYINGWLIHWHYVKQDDQIAINADSSAGTDVGKPLDVHDVVNSVTDAAGDTFYPKKDSTVPGLSWQLDEGGDIDWNKAGDYGVTITYFDNNSLETVTAHITIHIKSKATIDGHDGTAYKGVPKDIKDFLNGVKDAYGNDVDYDDARVGWTMKNEWWNELGPHTVTVSFYDKDTNSYVTDTITITIVDNGEDISGKDATYTVGDKHLTIDDLHPSAHKADGTTVPVGDIESDIDTKVKWDEPGNYTVDIWYTDDLTGQKVSTTVTVTVVAQENKGHIDAHNVNTWQGQPLDPSEAVDKLYDSHGNEITDPDQISNVEWNMHKDDWNNPNVYKNITLTYVDQYGVTITQTITVTVKEDDTAISGHDDSVIAGNAPSFSDLINNVTTADGTVIDDKGQLNDLITNGDIISTNFDDIDWSQVGTHDIEITYKDPTSGKEVTTTVTVTDDVNSISQSESNADSVSKSGSDSVSKSTSGSDSVSKSTSGSDSISASGSDSISKSTSGSDSISASGSDSISKSTSGSESISTSGSDSVSTSGSDSISASGSDSISKSTSGSESISTSGSDSVSTSGSDSVSKSTSGSESLSTSGSDSVSTSGSDSVSKSTSGSESISTSGSDSVSTSGSDSVSKSTSGSESLSTSGSDSVSTSGSDSVSKSTSGSESLSTSGSDSVSKSTSGSDSVSTSGSDSISKSTSGSESISTSGSDSVSTSGSDSVSKSTSGSDSVSTSGSDSISASGSDSISKSTSGSDSVSTSGSDSISASGSDSISKSTSGSESISTSGSDSVSK